MDCPTCRVALIITERLGVEIDHCPRCRGVWLDRGELDKIMERALRDRGALRRSDEDWDDDRRYEPRKSKKKRESWLEELFDF